MKINNFMPINFNTLNFSQIHFRGNNTENRFELYADNFNSLYDFWDLDDDNADSLKKSDFIERLSKENPETIKSFLFCKKTGLFERETPLQTAITCQDVNMAQSLLNLASESLSKEDLGKLLTFGEDSTLAKSGNLRRSPFYMAATQNYAQLADKILEMVKTLDVQSQNDFFNAKIIEKNDKAVKLSNAFMTMDMEELLYSTEFPLSSKYIKKFTDAKKDFQNNNPDIKESPVLFDAKDTCARLGIKYDSLKDEIAHRNYVNGLLASGNYMKNSETIWMGHRSQNQSRIPWKMHIYAVNEKDWKNLADIILPYLLEKDVTHKTLFDCNIDCLNSTKQKGKAFTIYPQTEDQFREIASALDKLIKENNLEISDSKIKGDKKLGSTGRIFYRYSAKSKKQADVPYSHEFYEKNRGGSKYMASDMTQQDDPFYDFNP